MYWARNLWDTLSRAPRSAPLEPGSAVGSSPDGLLRITDLDRPVDAALEKLLGILVANLSRECCDLFRLVRFQDWLATARRLSERNLDQAAENSVQTFLRQVKQIRDQLRLSFGLDRNIGTVLNRVACLHTPFLLD